MTDDQIDGPVDAGATADGATTDGATDDGAAEDDAAHADPEAGRTGRDVVVPDRVYKVVTVFSTLFAIVLVVGGMIALDVATNRGEAAAEDVELLRATAGVCSIVLGAAVYAFSSRFRAAGMGNPKDADDEQSDDGRRVR